MSDEPLFEKIIMESILNPVRMRIYQGTNISKIIYDKIVKLTWSHRTSYTDANKRSCSTCSKIFQPNFYVLARPNVYRVSTLSVYLVYVKEREEKKKLVK